MSDYRFWSGNDYLELPRDEQAWIVEPLLSPGALMNIYGATKTGKSRLALQLAIAVSTGQEHWLDKYKIHTHGPVLWLECDNSPAEWLQVLRDVVAAGYDISNIHFADREWVPYPFDLLDEDADHGGVLRAMIEQFTEEWGCPPVMIVIDTIREVHSGDEDKSTVMRNVVTQLQAATYPSAIVPVSHSRKDNGLMTGEQAAESEGNVANEQRGSNYLVGKMQTVIRLTRGKQYGWFTAIGRSIGTERFRMRQEAPTYFWSPDADPARELARELAKAHDDWSEREIARELAQVMNIQEEKARSIVRRTLKEDRKWSRTRTV